jgi:excinuclease ABC subunit C
MLDYWIKRIFNLLSREIIVPFAVDLGEQIKVTVPQLGDKKQILDLSTILSFIQIER